MTYSNFDDGTLNTILYHPREIYKDPYYLLTSYLFDNIRALIDLEENEEAWGYRLPIKLVDHYIQDCIEDFRQAGLVGSSIKIRGEGFSVRGVNTVDFRKAPHIIAFPKDKDDYIVSKSGIFNIKADFLIEYDERQKIYSENKSYFRKIIMTALDDVHNGWEKLTDMEIAVYMWAKWLKNIRIAEFISKEKVEEWWSENYTYFEIPLSEISLCLGLEEGSNVNSFHAFSAQRIREWNHNHCQDSVIDNITDEEADKRWYQILYKKYQRT